MAADGARGKQKVEARVWGAEEGKPAWSLGWLREARDTDFLMPAHLCGTARQGVIGDTERLHSFPKRPGDTSSTLCPGAEGPKDSWEAVLRPEAGPFLQDALWEGPGLRRSFCCPQPWDNTHVGARLRSGPSLSRQEVQLGQ